MAIENIPKSSNRVINNASLKTTVKAGNAGLENTKNINLGNSQNKILNTKGAQLNLQNTIQNNLQNLTNMITKNDSLMKALPKEVKQMVEQILKNTVQTSTLSDGVAKFLQNAKTGGEQIFKLALNLEQLFKKMSESKNDSKVGAELQNFKVTIESEGKEIVVKNLTDFKAFLEKMNIAERRELPTDIKKNIENLLLQNAKANGTVSEKQENLNQKVLQEVLKKANDLTPSAQSKLQHLLTQGDLSGIINSLHLFLKEQAKASSKSEQKVKLFLDKALEKFDSLMQNLTKEEKELLGKLLESYAKHGKLEKFDGIDEATLKKMKTLLALFSLKETVDDYNVNQLKKENLTSTLKEVATLVQKGVVVEGESSQASKVFNVSLPLVFAEGEKPYPAFIQVFKEQEKDKNAFSEWDKKKYGVWMRVILETENIGVVESSFHLFGDNQLTVKIKSSDNEVLGMVDEEKSKMKKALEELKFNLPDIFTGVN